MFCLSLFGQRLSYKQYVHSLNLSLFVFFTYLKSAQSEKACLF